MKALIQNAIRDEQGTATIEYAFVMGLVILAAMAVVGAFGNQGRRPMDKPQHRLSLRHTALRHLQDRHTIDNAVLTRRWNDPPSPNDG